MRFMICARLGGAALVIASLGRIAAQTPAGSLDAALTDFWQASGDRNRQIDRVLATGAGFEEIHARLAAGRSYSRDVPTGELAWQTIISGGARLPTTVIVPGDYDPNVKYPVRVYLHGGIARASIDSEARTPRRRLDVPPGCIAVYPSGFREATWWGMVQLDNLESILTRLKRAYNVDENRVHLIGVSDGGTGAFYFGMRQPTPWSTLFPLNGSLRVLSNPDVGVDGELYLTNLVNVPAYIINGGRDQLYPVAQTEPYIALLKRAGASVVFKPQMQAGHDTSWWPSERGAIDEFERTHPRDSLPDRISWQTDRTDRDNRFRWLVIDKLDDRRSSSRLDDYNTVEFINPPIKDEVFRHRRPSGRVDLERAGNVVRAKTRGVGAFTLFLSPTEFDFEKPIQVVVNGREAFQGAIKKDVRTMLRLAARDEDRAMLFAAELRIEVPAR
jgi:pimeloyl-ACP methyl ester carboxylesterase